MDNPDPYSNPRTPRELLGIMARGFAMGSADVVPGVSGGTMAFILGIYETLLDAIAALNAQFIRRLLRGQFAAAFDEFPWRFLLALGTGLLLAILTMAHFLSHALEHYPTYVWGFFFGLVLASVFVVRRRVKRWTPGAIALLILFTALMFLLVAVVPTETPNTPLFLFLSGALASCAMILPGISGAFILVLLGKYEYVLQAVVTRDFTTLALVAAGAVIGILLFSRVLRWLLHRYHDLTIAALMGLMLGSLRKIWPWKSAPDALLEGEAIAVSELNVLPQGLSPEVVAVVALAMAGFLLVILLEKLAERGSKAARTRLEPQPQAEH